MIYKTIHIKLKIEQHEPHQHRQCCGEVSNTNPTNTGSAAGKVGSYYTMMFYQKQKLVISVTKAGIR
jgi:hypothetical protein